MPRSRDEIYDELLVTRIRRGDAAAWEELWQRWNGRLGYYLRRLIDHEQDAHNALQEVWLQVLRGIGGLRDSARLPPWLYTIARRAALNHYRRAGRQFPADSGHCVEALADVETDPARQWEDAELVHYGLSQLNVAQRELLTLFFLEDLSIAEVASVLQVPPGTVKSRLHQARRALQQVLQRESE